MRDDGAPDPLLILIPQGRDAYYAAELLRGNGSVCRLCDGFTELCAAIDMNTGGVLVTDDALAKADLASLTCRLALLPPWSDLAFIVLTRIGPRYKSGLEAMRLPELLGNVVFLERPLAALALKSAVRSSMRARLRHRQIEQYLAAEVAAAAVRRSEAKFQSMADSVPALISMTDDAAMVIFANRHHEYLLGRPAEAILREGWMNIVLPESRETYQAAFLAAFHARSVFRTEAGTQDKDGQIRWLLWHGVPRLDDEGAFCGYTSCAVDVTDLKRAQEKLAELSREVAEAHDAAVGASRAKSRFLAGMSHELRTPLNGILGYAQLLRMEGGLSETQTARVDKMLGAGKHMLSMINSVLDLAKIEAEQSDVRTEEVDVQEIAAACLDLVRPAAMAKSLALGIVVEPGTRRDLVTDAARVRQVLVNLLGNAVKFTVSGAIELRLSSVAEGSRLRFEVADTGPGIPAELRLRLFQDFARLDTAGTSGIEGAGLGLALSARLAALMGGRLGHDDNPGGGSLFWLELPQSPVAILRAAPSDAAAANDGQPPEPVPILHVLVVDDIEMNREVASAFLQAAGQRVECVDGGAEAISAVELRDFDVVLMDVRMPEMDGLEATRRIRALVGARGRVPIVALTAEVFTDKIAECHAAGMNDHVVKPFTPDVLLAAVLRAASVAPRGSFPSPLVGHGSHAGRPGP